MNDRADWEQPEVRADEEAEFFAEEAYVALNRLSYTEGDHVIARYLMTRGLKDVAKLDRDGFDFGLGEQSEDRD